MFRGEKAVRSPVRSPITGLNQITRPARPVMSSPFLWKQKPFTLYLERIGWTANMALTTIDATTRLRGWDVDIQPLRKWNKCRCRVYRIDVHSVTVLFRARFCSASAGMGSEPRGGTTKHRSKEDEPPSDRCPMGLSRHHR